MNFLANKQIRDTRVLICKACPELAFKLAIPVCNKCGCPIKTKVFLEKPTCPLNKW